MALSNLDFSWAKDLLTYNPHYIGLYTYIYLHTIELTF